MPMLAWRDISYRWMVEFELRLKPALTTFLAQPKCLDTPSHISAGPASMDWKASRQDRGRRIATRCHRDLPFFWPPHAMPARTIISGIAATALCHFLKMRLGPGSRMGRD